MLAPLTIRARYIDELVSTGQQWSAISADWPSPFRTYSAKGQGRSASRHYQTMTIEQIAALPVASIAAPDCVLFFWATMPQLPAAIGIIKAWSFTYKTAAFTWIKQSRSGSRLHWGMGFSTRSNAEICLLATRGSPKRIAANVHSVIISPVQEHSRKPDEALERIERLVGGPYVELFARRQRPGWSACGDQLEI
jgi:N6-adenosine-specific RNA methylase IME4